MFEQALVQEKLYSNKSDRNEKIIAVVAVGIVCLVIGGFICLAIKNAADEHAHRQQLEQNITNLDQQVAQAQLRLDQAHAHAREPRPAFAAGQETQYWNQVHAEQNVERIALDELFQLQTRATAARNELFQYDQKKREEAREWRERSEAWERKRQLDRIEEALRNK